MTPTERKRLRELAEKATPGEWRWSKLHESKSLQIVGPLDELICELHYHPEHNDNNTDFITAARTAVPQLLDLVEELEEKLEIAKSHIRFKDLGVYQEDLKDLKKLKALQKLRGEG